MADENGTPDMIEVHAPDGNFPDVVHVTPDNAQAAGEVEPK